MTIKRGLLVCLIMFAGCVEPADNTAPDVTAVSRISDSPPAGDITGGNGPAASTLGSTSAVDGVCVASFCSEISGCPSCLGQPGFCGSNGICS